MRRTLLQALLVLTAAFCVQGSAVAQGNAPQGSYLQSYQNIRTHGDRLSARCKTKDGNWRDTSMDDYRRCTTDIGNDDGNLRCAYGDNDRNRRHDDDDDDYRNRNAPRGSYLQSCRDIRARGNRLTARCQTRDGNWRDTSMNNYQRCSTDIGNDDGNLRCSTGGRQYNGYGRPQGSYLQSCQDIRTHG